MIFFFYSNKAEIQVCSVLRRCKIIRRTRRGNGRTEELSELNIVKGYRHQFKKGIPVKIWWLHKRDLYFNPSLRTLTVTTRPHSVEIVWWRRSNRWHLTFGIKSSFHRTFFFCNFLLFVKDIQLYSVKNNVTYNFLHFKKKWRTTFVYFIQLYTGTRETQRHGGECSVR